MHPTDLQEERRGSSRHANRTPSTRCSTHVHGPKQREMAPHLWGHLFFVSSPPARNKVLLTPASLPGPLPPALHLPIRRLRPSSQKAPHLSHPLMDSSAELAAHGRTCLSLFSPPALPSGLRRVTGSMLTLLPLRRPTWAASQAPVTQLGSYNQPFKWGLCRL